MSPYSPYVRFSSITNLKTYYNIPHCWVHRCLKNHVTLIIVGILNIFFKTPWGYHSNHRTLFCYPLRSQEIVHNSHCFFPSHMPRKRYYTSPQDNPSIEKWHLVGLSQFLKQHFQFSKTLWIITLTYSMKIFAKAIIHFYKHMTPEPLYSSNCRKAPRYHWPFWGRPEGHYSPIITII